MTPAARRDQTPSATLPLSYLATAAPASLMAALGIVWLAPELGGHYYHPRLFALAHTVTLGWITLAIVGASYQIIPIVLGRALWSERLARWQYGALVAGIAGMVAHFLLGEWIGLAGAAMLVALALGAHGVNVALTVRGLSRWTFTARLVVLGHIGLALTAATGVLLGIDKAWKFLPGGALANVHAHVHVALLGWVVPMVIGVAARVYPMFLLAPEPGGRAGTLQLWGLVLGVPGVTAGIAFGWTPLVAVAALAVAVAIGGHLAWMREVVVTRKRPALDWPLRFVLTGTAFLVPATLAGLALAFDVVAGPRAALAYVALGLGGWVSLSIAGMMLKIVPFLVWYHVYASHAGRAPVPTLAGLSCTHAEALAYWLLTGGVVALTVGLAGGHPGAIRAAGVVVTAGALAFAGALGHVLSHLRHCAAPVVVAAPSAQECAS